LRPGTTKAATEAKGKLKTRLSTGEKGARKRVAEVAAVYDVMPVVRVPGDRFRPLRLVVRKPRDDRDGEPQVETNAARTHPRDQRACASSLVSSIAWSLRRAADEEQSIA